MSYWLYSRSLVAAAGSLDGLVLWWGTADFYATRSSMAGLAVSALSKDSVGPCPVRHLGRDVSWSSGVDLCGLVLVGLLVSSWWAGHVVQVAVVALAARPASTASFHRCGS